MRVMCMCFFLELIYSKIGAERTCLPLENVARINGWAPDDLLACRVSVCLYWIGS